MSQTTSCTRNLEIEIPAGEVEREYTRIAQGFQKKARIPGFRPGKAPLSLVRQHFNGKIREELMETLVPAHLRAAFERESVEPVSSPTLEKLDFDGEIGSRPIKFQASFEVMPSFELGDYKSIRVEKPTTEVSEAEIDEAVERALESLRERHCTLEPVEAAEGPEPLEAKPGLVAMVEVRVEGETHTDQEPTAIEVGGKATMAEFTTALTGMKVGEERDLEVSYPAEFPNTSLAGKTRKYHLRLNGIQRKVEPELTDAFIEQNTGNATRAAFRERVAGEMRAERTHEGRHRTEEAVIDGLLAQTEFPVPEALVEKQVDAKLERNLRGLADQGIDPRKLKLDWTKLRERHQDAARREVRASLLLERIATAESIEAGPDAVEHELRQAAAELKQPLEAVRQRAEENGALDRIKNRIRQEQVLEFLVRNATS